MEAGTVGGCRSIAGAVGGEFDEEIVGQVQLCQLRQPHLGQQSALGFRVWGLRLSIWGLGLEGSVQGWRLKVEGSPAFQSTHAGKTHTHSSLLACRDVPK
eukprot:3204095-Rhodomonas_salina.1